MKRVRVLQFRALAPCSSFGLPVCAQAQIKSHGAHQKYFGLREKLEKTLIAREANNLTKDYFLNKISDTNPKTAHFQQSKFSEIRLLNMYVTISRPAVDPLVVSWIGTALAVGYAAYLTYTSASNRKADGKGTPVNLGVKKDQPKVVDTFDVEDLGNKNVFCRCWRSKKFPYCDGAHVAHNKNCDDNVGPLIIQKRDV